MGSGLTRHLHVGAHDWGQVLTFQGKSCSLLGHLPTGSVSLCFTDRAISRRGRSYLKHE
jgi:hypothetical protein